MIAVIRNLMAWRERGVSDSEVAHRIKIANLETLAHEELVKRFGYAPDEALVRVRRAVPPKVLEPK